MATAPPDPASPEARIGTAIAGKFRIERVLGAGGMGVVYVATDLALQREVALKMLLDDHVHEQRPERRERFETEARAAARLSHPNIVVVHEFGLTDDGHPYIVQELLHGETLHEILADEGTLDVESASEILQPIMRGVAYAHRCGVVHRDLKPENILVHETADGALVPKILDFGIARIESAARRTREGQALGTLRYMSPEQLRGKGVGPWCDVWAMAVIWYECLTGAFPLDFPADADAIATMAEILTGEISRVRARRPDLPRSIAAFIDDSLTRSTSTRPRDMGAMLARFDAALARVAAPGEVRPLDGNPASEGWTDDEDGAHRWVAEDDDEDGVHRWVAEDDDDEVAPPRPSDASPPRRAVAPTVPEPFAGRGNALRAAAAKERADEPEPPASHILWSDPLVRVSVAIIAFAAVAGIALVGARRANAPPVPPPPRPSALTVRDAATLVAEPTPQDARVVASRAADVRPPPSEHATADRTRPGSTHRPRRPAPTTTRAPRATEDDFQPLPDADPWPGTYVGSDRVTDLPQLPPSECASWWEARGGARPPTVLPVTTAIERASPGLLAIQLEPGCIVYMREDSSAHATLNPRRCPTEGTPSDEWIMTAGEARLDGPALRIRVVAHRASRPCMQVTVTITATRQSAPP